ncbi:hypothetical protein N7532_008225 [Penicillium argentinense]|uniref:Peptidase C14 caspase domain-containing protein n=1 Tax=Penicillium argentinense TaxID=1131581 RepID=A0A9W9EX68_9EURO|nr:uncharacterized protein N7532_008225 [Penicillium argentinense]KAJ5089541.1 hypothetical protein N7532_008225 [Penicillium argentinense]
MEWCGPYSEAFLATTKRRAIVILTSILLLAAYVWYRQPVTVRNVGNNVLGRKLHYGGLFNGTWDYQRDKDNLLLDQGECEQAFPALFDEIERAKRDRQSRDMDLSLYWFAQPQGGTLVLYYYSGHGGVAKSGDAAEENKDRNKNVNKSGDKDQQQWRYQFLVPVDFDQSTPYEFRGITEIEISYLLRDTTDQTRNITVILDCCHSGRMAREPSCGGNATPKNLSLQGARYYRDIERLSGGGGGGRAGRQEYVEGNPHAVRIAAAATAETVWEYEYSDGKWTGALSDALIRVLGEAKGHSNSVSWRTTVLRVRELVNAKFPLQRPQVEGPATRCHFSLKEMGSDALHLKMEGDDGLAVIQAGKVAGVREGNVYHVVPFDAATTTTKDSDDQADNIIAEGVVSHVDCFRVVVGLASKNEQLAEIPLEGALACLEQEALNKWPATTHSEILPAALEELIRGSRYLCIARSDEREAAIGRIQRLADLISLRTREGVQIASQWIEPSNDSMSSPVAGTTTLSSRRIFGPAIIVCTVLFGLSAIVLDYGAVSVI